MIIDFALTINTYFEKIKNNYSVTGLVCPKCKANHSLIKHGKYKRYVCTLNNNEICILTLFIQRVLCKSCGVTHAILPGDIIPYKIYSYPVVITVLNKYFIFKQSILNIINEYNISFQLIYSFISTLHIFIPAIYLILKDLIGYVEEIKDTASILDSINNYTKINFSIEYFLKNQWILFMTKFKNKSPPKNRMCYVGIRY